MNLLRCTAVPAVLTALCFLACSKLKPEPRTFYVSPAGSDTWSGGLPDAAPDGMDGPFRTLERARLAARQWKKERGLAPSGIRIRLRGGVYALPETFRLGKEDGGTENAPVVWCAFPGECVRLAGGIPVRAFGPVTDPAVLSRIEEPLRDRIRVLDLKESGIADAGSVGQRGGPGLELFYGGLPMIPARWPDSGWAVISDVPQETGEPVFEGNLPHMRFGIPAGRHFGYFSYSGNRPSRWSPENEILLHGFWTWDWYDSFLRVKKIDTNSKRIHVEPPHSRYGYTKQQRFYALNILEELDKPGEYVVDRKNGLLYFLPPGPVTAGNTLVSVLEDPLWMLEETDQLRLEGLVFEAGRGDGVVITGGSGNVLAGCAIRNLGGTAVRIEGGRGNGVQSSDIHHTGAGIALSGGDRETLTPAGNFAENNHIHHYSRIIKTYTPAIRLSGAGNRLAHNEIHDAPHSAVIFGGNDHVLEYNHVHHIALETGDVGAFYMGRDWTERGNVIRYNYFHDLSGPGLHGVMAVYLDDFASGTRVCGNVFVRAGRAAFIGGGRDNVIENNLFIGCAPSVHVDARGLGWAHYYFDSSFPYSVNTLFERMEAVDFRRPPYSVRYPELLTLYGDEPAVPKHNRIVRNVSAGGRWLDLHDGLDFDIVHVEGNVIADPVLCRWYRKRGEGASVHRRGEGELEAILLSGGNVLPEGFQDQDSAADVNGLNSIAGRYGTGFGKIPFERIGLFCDRWRTVPPE